MSSTLHSTLESAARAWADWMRPMAWQVALLVAILSGVTWLLRRRSALLLYSLWLLVPIRLILPPGFALATGWAWWIGPRRAPAPVASPLRPAKAIVDPGVGAGDPPSSVSLEYSRDYEHNSNFENSLSVQGKSRNVWSWTARVFLAWAAGAGILVLKLALGGQRVRGWTRAARPLDDPALLSLVERWRARLGLRRPVGLRCSDLCGIPLVVGLRRPLIVLPGAVIERLDHAELEAVLIHELHHVGRCDIALNLFQAILGALYFFHPLVWWANVRLRRFREDACDELTVATLDGRRRAYGSGLVKVAELAGRPAPRLALGIVEPSHSIRRRLARILGPDLPRGRMGWASFLILLGLAAVVLPAAGRDERTGGGALAARDAAPQAENRPASTAARPHPSHGPVAGEPILAFQDQRKPAGAAPKDAPADEFLPALDMAVGSLKRQQRADGSWPGYKLFEGGTTSLALLALLNAGTPPDDPAVRRGLTYLRAIESDWTYVVALQTMVFCAADPKADSHAIRRNVKWLEQTQHAGGPFPGTWGYGNRQGPSRGDNSNTQYALLALWDASRAGFPVEQRVWELSRHYLTMTQASNGGWGYMGDDHRATGSMTAAGLIGLAITGKALRGGKEPLEQGAILDRSAEMQERRLKRALGWLGTNFERSLNDPSNAAWLYYYIYDLGRAGRLTDQPMLGKHDWYHEIGRFLLEKQDRRTGRWKANREFDDSTISTSFAILFLSRAPDRGGAK